MENEKKSTEFTNIYPMRISTSIGLGIHEVEDTNILVDASDAIKIEITVNRNDYSKQKIYEALKIAFQKFLEYYD